MKRSPLLALFITVLIDMLGVGIIIPVLAPLFLSPTAGLFPVETSQSVRTIALGLMGGMFPLMQLIGAPLLGALADRHGRKKILLVSLFGTLLGYVLFALGIVLGNLPLLFFSRALDGFTGGNISIAMSAIADISDEKSRTKNFGLIGMSFGIGFIIGPYIGGVLSDPTNLPFFNFATPFWAATILCALNIMLVITNLPETLKQKLKKPFSVLTGFINIRRAFQMKTLRTMFIVSFLLTCGFSFFSQFFQVYLIDRFTFTQGQIGNLFAYIGLWIALTQGFITRFLTKYKSEHVLRYSIFGLAIAIPSLIIPQSANLIYFINPFIAIFQGITNPNITNVISGLADKQSQGEILGISQSVQSLAMTLPPVVAGFLATFDVRLPIIMAGCMILGAWIIFVTQFKKPTAKFSEI